MRKLLCVVLCLALLPIAALAEQEAPALLLDKVAEVIRPGKAVLLTFTVPGEGVADVTLCTASGDEVLTVVEAHPVSAGYHQLWWNGTYAGVPAEAGEYLLTLHFEGETVSTPVTVGAHAPYLNNITATKDAAAHTLTVDLYASVDGLLSVGLWAAEKWSLLQNVDVTAGENAFTWDMSGLPQGTTALTLTLTDATGYSSNEEHLAVTPEELGLTYATPTVEPTATPTAEPTATPTAEPTATPTAEPTATPTPEPTATPEPTPAQVFTPSYGMETTVPGEAANYWNTPMDITDEAAIWAMLNAPFTYIDGNARSQAAVYSAKDTNSPTVGVVTRDTQGIRVLESYEDGWSLIQSYSSSFKKNTTKAWNLLFQGYVKTNTIKTKTLKGKYHLVIDKLTQRLYIFSEGKLYDTLLISTGVANDEQPFNETRSGEFIIGSPTGEFKSDNMYCAMGLRYNDGDLLHEVPHLKRADGGKDYKRFETKLGQRASHGCIRVQRKKTPLGTNMKWIWDHRKELGRLVIWEDWQGRQVSIPDPDTVLYYNPAGGDYYHRAESCYSVTRDGVTFEAFTYAQLDEEPYSKLEFCPYCAPAQRLAELEAINELHAPGGDHDPVMTRAQQKFLDALAEKLQKAE